LPDSSPYILECDRTAIESYNHNATTEGFHIATELLPEPFLGDIAAPLVILLLNPGVSSEDFAWQGIQANRSLILDGIQGRRGIHFHIEHEASSPGARWWHRVSRHLCDHFGREVVARRLMAVQYFPYHSKRFGHARLKIPSQKYGFSLVSAAVQRGALIVCVRGRWLWQEAVPELKTYPRFSELKNPRNASLSPGNSARFDEMLDVIGRSPLREQELQTTER